jgi:undecaprenyl pyrophosphate phosphatase UppP
MLHEIGINLALIAAFMYFTVVAVTLFDFFIKKIDLISFSIFCGAIALVGLVLNTLDKII